MALPRPAGRWLAAAVALAAASGPAAAQTVLQHTPGYLLFRVNLGGTVAAAGPGGAGGIPGPAATPPPSGAEGIGFGGAEGFTPPPTGMPAAGPGGPLPGGPVPGAAPGGARTNHSLTVVAVVPYQKILKKPLNLAKPLSAQNPNWEALQLTTDRNAVFTAPLLYADNTLVQVTRVAGTPPERWIDSRYKEWDKKKSFDGMQDLAAEALSLGLNDRCLGFLAELQRMTETWKEPTPPARVVETVKAYKQVVAHLDKPLPPAPDEEVWRERFQAAGIAESPHYALVHFGDTHVSPESVQRRLDALERNYRAFFLWHVLLGRPQPAPPYRLLVVLAARASDLPRLKDALDGHPIASDSFYSPTHNIVVLSPERLDDAGRAFSRYVQGQFQSGWNREDLLRGKAPPLGGAAKTTVQDVARMMTLALVDRKLEEEADHAAISREGTRQLLSATGVLAQHVALPQWLESGTGALLSKPKGPYAAPPVITETNVTPPTAATPGTKPNTIAVGLIPGYGLPNYLLARRYRDMSLRKELNPDPASLLRNTVLDRYFDAARSGTDADPPVLPAGAGELSATAPAAAPMSPFGTPPGVPPAPGAPGAAPAVVTPQQLAVKAAQSERLAAKAQVTAWALTYYLARTRPAQLARFYAELNKLPRDLRVDRDEVFRIFARSFNLMSADGTRVSDDAVRALAVAWAQSMNSVNQTAVDVALSEFKADATAATGGAEGAPPGSSPAP